jgi:hypothetical protein
MLAKRETNTDIDRNKMLKKMETDKTVLIIKHKKNKTETNVIRLQFCWSER